MRVPQTRVFLLGVNKIPPQIVIICKYVQMYACLLSLLLYSERLFYISTMYE